MTTPNPSEGAEQHTPTTVQILRAAEVALSNPLKAETRKARLYLLGLSMVGITIVKTGLVPQEITTLGMTFGEADRQSLLDILALVVLYFLVAFLIYGISDFLAWRYAYLNVSWSAVGTVLSELGQQIKKRADNPAIKEEVDSLLNNPELTSAISEEDLKAGSKFLESARALASLQWTYNRYSQTTPIVLWGKALFEFLLPVLVGLFAIYALVSA